jgi:glycerophosphoryl diester phosphodiesterase
MRLPTIIGHRGARASAPENTLAGIAEAARQGARWVEFDVKLTRDRVPILMHDDTLAATTGVERKVAETDLADLAGLDALPMFLRRYPTAGRSFVARHGASPVRIATLEQALRLALELGLGVNIELKPCPGRAVETASIALGIARLIWPGFRPPPLVSSFSIASLAAARRVAPDWPRGLLLARIGCDWRARAEQLAAATINVNAVQLTARRVEALRTARRPVLAWTVNSPARARLLLRWGVSSIFTDRLELLLGAIV